MRILITEEQFKGILKKSLLNEISNVSKKTNITVCSLDDFYKICKRLGITPENVDNQNEYAFIEIGSGLPRWKASVHHMRDDCFDFDPGVDGFSQKNPYDMFKYQYYFPFEQKFSNVLRLMYDDNQEINNKTKKVGDKNFYTDGNIAPENNATCVNLSPGETRTGKKEKFYYSGAIGSSVEDYQAIKEFVDRMLSKNPDIKFIIHCMQGMSRSAAVGTYVARKVAEIKNLDWKSYMMDYYEEHKNPTLPGQKHQFKVGKSRRGNPRYPHSNTLTGLGNLEGWNEKGSKAKSWVHPFMKEYGEMNDKRNGK